MTKIEKQMLGTVGVMVVLVVLLSAYIVSSVKSEFGDCKGLEGAVNQIWTGEDCDETQNDR